MEQLNPDGLLIASPAAIHTYSGGWITPLSPEPEMIKIEDIAHSLSNQCRFTGHTREFYSVGEHSIHCSDIVVDLHDLVGGDVIQELNQLRLAALLHDAAEAYLADLARPIKKAPGLGEIYLKVEGALEQVICEKYGLPFPVLDGVIKEADEVMLGNEIHQLFGEEFSGRWHKPEIEVYVPQFDPGEAEEVFLNKFYEYGGK